MPAQPSLYERLGAQAITDALTEFYRRAFVDGIIGHFFHGKDQAHITAMQIDFAVAMLGGPRRYQGRPLEAVHHALAIRTPHFGRRQMLFRQVLDDQGVAAELRDAWLEREEQLRPLIMAPGGASCSHTHRPGQG